MKDKFTLGADPEMFVRNKPLSGKPTGLITPICGKVGGTKEKPIPFSPSATNARTREYKYQEDNVAFEVNVPPSSDAITFDRTIGSVLVHSRALLDGKGLTLDLKKSAHRFSVEDLKHPNAMVIGCDPDMCAYGGAGDSPLAREPFDIKDLGTWRFAGGHVHFGYNMELGIPPHVVVRLIDALVYLPIIGGDKQKMRRTKYGLAGLYRCKPYGVEYRTMSNFWLTEPSKVGRRAFNLLNDIQFNLDLLFDFYQALPIEDVKACIDASGEGMSGVWSKIRKLPNFSKLHISENEMDHRSNMAVSNPANY